MKKYGAVLLFFAMLFGSVNGHAEGGNLDFAVIQPGQPGTEAEARPVMDALADYIQRKMGSDIAIQGRYFNQLEPAMAFLTSSPPGMGNYTVGGLRQVCPPFSNDAHGRYASGRIYKGYLASDGP